MKHCEPIDLTKNQRKISNLEKNSFYNDVFSNNFNRLNPVDEFGLLYEMEVFSQTVYSDVLKIMHHLGHDLPKNQNLILCISHWDHLLSDGHLN